MKKNADMTAEEQDRYWEERDRILTKKVRRANAFATAACIFACIMIILGIIRLMI